MKRDKQLTKKWYIEDCKISLWMNKQRELIVSPKNGTLH